MSGDCRKPVIGWETHTEHGWVADQAAHIAAHLSYQHLESVAIRGEGWVVLLKDPETGLHWESHRFQGGLQGGGPYSLVPLSDDDIIRLYGVQPPRKVGEPVIIKGSLVEQRGEVVIDQCARIAAHLRENHLMELDQQREQDGISLCVDPMDGSYWEVKVTGYGPGAADELLTLTMLSEEAKELDLS